MNSCRTLIAGFAAGLSLLSAASAAEAGLIGKRYAGPDFTYDHFTGSTVDRALGAAAEVNLPVAQAFDFNLRYSYADAAGDNYDAIEKRLGASILTHRHTEYGTAYFAGTLGHLWQSVDVLGVGARENGGFWGVRAGYEITVARSTAIDAGIGYSDTFENRNRSGRELRYYVAANHWFSSDLAGVVSAAYRQIRSAPDMVSYTAGLRWAF